MTQDNHLNSLSFKNLTGKRRGGREEGSSGKKVGDGGRKEREREKKLSKIYLLLPFQYRLSQIHFFNYVSLFFGVPHFQITSLICLPRGYSSAPLPQVIYFGKNQDGYEVKRRILMQESMRKVQ